MKVTRDGLMKSCMSSFALLYILLLIALLGGNLSFSSPSHLWAAVQTPDILASLQLSLITSVVSAFLSMFVGIPLGYFLSRSKSKFRGLVDILVDIPILLPPLVIGLSLLIFFQSSLGKVIEDFFRNTTGRSFTYDVPGIILAQFTVAAAFATRSMEVAFSKVPLREEVIAQSLGCSWSRSFFSVVLPQVKRGGVTAMTIAWARSLGEFGPILIFAGTTRMKTEVLPTTIFLELSVGKIEAAVAVSFLMIVVATLALITMRSFTKRDAV